MVEGALARIRAVLFDVDGTLYAQLPLRVAMACEMALASMSLQRRGRQDVRRVLTFRRLREDLRGRPSHVESLERRQYSVVSEQLRCSVEDVESAVAEWIYRRPTKWLRYCRRPGLEPLLDFLASRGISCGVFSDYPATEKISALGLDGRFDVVVSAVDNDVGAFKPDARGFLAAARRWNMPADQVLYVGDRADVDAAGAAAAGMPCAVLARASGQQNGFLAVRGFKELQRVLNRNL
jgi:phosphoglycolate phosphatase/putative hydrolase of the HAD superfamily